MKYQVLPMPRQLDLESAAQTRAQIETACKEKERMLVLDFKHCEVLDSSGLGMLVHATTDQDVEVCLVGLSARIRDLFKLTQVDMILNIYQTMDSAVEALTPVPVR